jgi:putative DNA methylase
MQALDPITKRLIEEWLPIAELGEESMREQRSMTDLPPIVYLHLWRGRRSLVSSQSGMLPLLLPADADRKLFLHRHGIHRDPVAAHWLKPMPSHCWPSLTAI